MNQDMAKLYVKQNDIDSKIPSNYILLTNAPVDIVQFKPNDKLHLSFNPSKITPFLLDDDIKVFGSVAVLTHVAETYAKNALYGSTPEERAKINSVLLWTASTFHRLSIRNFVRPQQGDRSHHLSVEEDNKLLIEQGLTNTKAQLDVFEKFYFEKKKFLCGEEETIADLFLVNILMELEKFELDLSKWPKLFEWYKGLKPKIQKVSQS